MRLRPRLVDRYVLGEMVGPFFVGLVVYSFLFLITLLFQLANLVIQEGLSAGTVGLMFLLSLPNLLAYTLPIATLLGTIIAFGRLSSDSEVIALKAAGVPARKLVVPPLLFSGAVAALLLLFNLWLVPYCRAQADRIQSEAAQAANLVRLLRPGVFFDRIPGVLIYAAKVNLQEARYDRVLVFQHGAPSVDILTTADSGRLVRSEDGTKLQFLLENGETLQFDRKAPGKVQRSTFLVQTLTVEAPPAATGGGFVKALSELSVRELVARLNLRQESDNPKLALRERFAFLYELHRRFAASLAALFFALVGIPLGMVNTRGGKGAGFSLSLLVLLGYWVMLSALGDLSMAGRLRPELGAWLPDLALLLVALALLSKMDRIPETGWVRRLLALFPGRTQPLRRGAGEGILEPISLTRGVPLVDRYIFGKAIRLFVLVVLSVLLLDWVIEVRGLSEYITGQDKLRQLASFLLNQTPGVLAMLTPLAILVTAMVTFAMLERTNELTAMKASGISLYRVSMPALTLGLAACLFLWVMGEGIVPSTSRKAQLTRNAIKNVTTRNVASALDVWVFAPDRSALYHYNHYDAKTRRFQGFSLYKLERNRFRVESRFFAKEAVFVEPARSPRHLLSARASAGESTQIAFLNGWTWSRDASHPFLSEAGGRMDVGLPHRYFIVPPFLEGQYFSSQELRKLITELREKGYPSYQQRVDYYQKFADTTAPLVLLLLGLPFAFVTGRKGSLYGIAIALALSVTYYTLEAVFNSVGAAQWLDPALAAWAPAVLLGCAGGYMLLNLRT